MGIPITYGFGLLNKVRDTNNPNPKKLRLTGPFFSIGVALRYYYELHKKNKIGVPAYHTYMFNLGDQLKAFERLDEQLKLAAPAPDSTPAAPGAIKKKSTARLWTDQHQQICEALMSPAIGVLETHGGNMTRELYAAADQTLKMHHSLTQFFTFEEYENQKSADAATRSLNKKKNRPESKLYFIDFRKDVEENEAIKQIPTDHPAFKKYLTIPRRTLVVRTAEGSGTRTVWYGGSFGNKRASRLIFGQRNAKKFKLRGPVYVLCTPSADLSIRGGVALDKNWKGPVVDLGDQEDQTAGDKKTDKIAENGPIPAVMDLSESDQEDGESEEGETDSEDDSDIDEEFVAAAFEPKPAPAPKQTPTPPAPKTPAKRTPAPETHPAPPSKRTKQV